MVSVRLYEDRICHCYTSVEYSDEDLIDALERNDYDVDDALADIRDRVWEDAEDFDYDDCDYYNEEVDRDDLDELEAALRGLAENLQESDEDDEENEEEDCDVFYIGEVIDE